MTDEEFHENTGRRQSDDIIIQLKEKVDQLVAAIGKMSNAILGDGSKDNPGLMIEVDRLKQWRMDQEKKEDHSWQWRIGLTVPILLLLLERAFHYSKGMPH